MNWWCRLFGRRCPMPETTVEPVPPSAAEMRFDRALAAAERRIESAERTTRRVHAIASRRDAGAPIAQVFLDARRHLSDPLEGGQ